MTKLFQPRVVNFITFETTILLALLIYYATDGDPLHAVIRYDIVNSSHFM
jgi:hypothetical protein